MKSFVKSMIRAGDEVKTIFWLPWGDELVMWARPIRYWKWFYWHRYPGGLQTPWLTIVRRIRTDEP